MKSISMHHVTPSIIDIPQLTYNVDSGSQCCCSLIRCPALCISGSQPVRGAANPSGRNGAPFNFDPHGVGVRLCWAGAGTCVQEVEGYCSRARNNSLLDCFECLGVYRDILLQVGCNQSSFAQLCPPPLLPARAIMTDDVGATTGRDWSSHFIPPEAARPLAGLKYFGWYRTHFTVADLQITGAHQAVAAGADVAALAAAKAAGHDTLLVVESLFPELPRRARWTPPHTCCMDEVGANAQPATRAAYFKIGDEIEHMMRAQHLRMKSDDNISSSLPLTPPLDIDNATQPFLHDGGSSATRAVGGRFHAGGLGHERCHPPIDRDAAHVLHFALGCAQLGGCAHLPRKAYRRHVPHSFC
jgi:hypothetical protein